MATDEHMKQKKILEIGFQTQLFPKQKKLDVGKLNIFVNLIGQNSQLRRRILILTPTKIKLAFGASHVTWLPYIVCAFESFLFLTF